jgi:hypothetical protein
VHYRLCRNIDHNQLAAGIDEVGAGINGNQRVFVGEHVDRGWLAIQRNYASRRRVGRIGDVDKTDLLGLSV